jgi:4-alpha-glucanotransferase
MRFERSSGILLHPTSLPSRGGIGDFGPAAYAFVDFLAQARQGMWQVLPLGPLGLGNSPYSSLSAFAGNELLISLERLAERGWIAASELDHLTAPHARVHYDEVRAGKMPLLRKAAEKFLDHRHEEAGWKKFERFCWENGWWLEDYVLFAALRDRYPGMTWNGWPEALRRRDPVALDDARLKMKRELAIRRALQFFFFEQWWALHHACRQRGIGVVGDVAIFVSYDSADVWTHPDIFHLDHDLHPTVVSGVPPDMFSKTGQRWGNPLYRWDVLQHRNFDWWTLRMRMALATCDIIRIDHFRGFEQYWEIPAREPTAIHGHWVDGPRDAFFHALRHALGKLPLIAEDLGYITPEVHALRERFQIPGMRILQFGFGDAGSHVYLPHRYEPNTVVYTGTHDNDTAAGWWRNGASAQERAHAATYLGDLLDGIHWAMIRAALASVADLCLVPLQDVLGLGSDARMNVPSESDGNWSWRYAPDALDPKAAARLAALTELTDRDGHLRRVQQHPPASGGDFAV